MHRRSLLAMLAGAAVTGTGCSTSTPGGPATTTASPTDDEDGAPTRSPIPAGAVSFGARVTRQATPDHPPTVELSLTNVADVALDLEFGYVVPFGGLRAESGPGALELVPETQREGLYTEGGDSPIAPEERRQGCWRLPEWVLWPDAATRRSLEPGQAVSETYAVYNGPGTSCFPTGEYRFRDALRSFTLTFTLTVDATSEVEIPSATVVERG